MRLTRVFVDAPLASGEQLLLPAGPARSISRACCGCGAGDALRLFNGRGGEYEATIESRAPRCGVTLRIGAHHAVERESPLQVTLLQGIARGEKMDLILQKATELGVTRVVPLTMVRSTVRLDDAGRPRKQQQHWQAVVIGACEQMRPQPRARVCDAPAVSTQCLQPAAGAAAAAGAR